MRSGCGFSSMSHRLSSGSPVATPAAHSDKRPPLNDSIPMSGFGATLKDTLGQGTGHASAATVLTGTRARTASEGISVD
jgi:hypothetical protein